MTQPGDVKPIAYLRAVRRRWPLVVICFVLGLAAGYVTAKSPAPAARVASQLTPGAPTANQYQATAILMPVAAAAASSSGADPSGLSVAGMAYFATTGSVPRMVAQQLGYKGDPNVLAKEVQITTNTSIGAIQISAAGTQPDAIVKLVNAFSQQLIAYLNQLIQTNNSKELAAESAQMQSVQKQISGLQAQPANSVNQAQLAAAQAQYAKLLALYEQLTSAPQQTTLTVVQAPVATPSIGLPSIDSSSASSGSTASGTSSAATATSTSSSHGSLIPQGRKTRTLLGGIVGILVGLALAVLIDRFDTRVYDRSQAEEAFGLPVLAEIASGGREDLPVRNDPMSPAAEGYRILQAAVVAPSADGGAGSDRPMVVLVARVSGQQPATTVAANLAECFRDGGTPVTVITSRGESPSQGLLAQETRVLGPDLPNDSPGAQSTRLEKMIESARLGSGVVVVDTSPVLTTHEAARLAPHADAVVLVATYGRDKGVDAQRAVSTLRRVGAPLTGVVLLQDGRSPIRSRRSKSKVKYDRREAARHFGSADTPDVGVVEDLPSYASNE